MMQNAHAKAADLLLGWMIAFGICAVRVRVFRVLIFVLQLDRRHRVNEVRPRRRAEFVFVVSEQSLVQHLRHVFLVEILADEN